MIIPIIVILLSVAVLVIMSRPIDSKKKNESSKQMVAAQDFINVRDIVDHVLYTQDDYAISYVRLQPPMSSLWSKREKRMRTNTLVAEVSKDKAPWILTAVSRPMDITQLINQYRQKRDETDDPIRKQILKQETRELQTKVGAGEAIERQFFIKVWMNNKPGVEAELMDRARNIISAYESIGVLGHILKKPEIIRYCNLVHNPAYINMDDVSVDANMPFIFDVEEDAS